MYIYIYYIVLLKCHKQLIFTLKFVKFFYNNIIHIHFYVIMIILFITICQLTGVIMKSELKRNKKISIYI